MTDSGFFCVALELGSFYIFEGLKKQNEKQEKEGEKKEIAVILQKVKYLQVFHRCLGQFFHGFVLRGGLQRSWEFWETSAKATKERSGKVWAEFCKKEIQLLFVWIGYPPIICLDQSDDSLSISAFRWPGNIIRVDPVRFVCEFVFILPSFSFEKAQ